MLASILFFTSSLLLGLAITKIAKLELGAGEKITIAITLGTVLQIILIFLLSYFSPFSSKNTLLVILPVLFISSLYTYKEINFKSLKKIPKLSFVTIISFSLIFSVVTILFLKSLILDGENLVAGNRLVWVDWPIHFAISSSFTNGDNFPPQNPLYSGQFISYPFFSDFLASILQTLGASLSASFIFSGLILSFAIIVLIYQLGKILTNKKAAMLGLFISLFWGGLGFIYYFQDLFKSQNLLEFIKFPPHEYTFYQEKGLWFFTFLYSELLPQRAILLGIPIFLSSLILFIYGCKSQQKKYFLVSAFLIGVLPFFHMHTLISCVIFYWALIPLLLLNELKKNHTKSLREKLISMTLFFLLPIFFLLLIQLPFLTLVNLNQTIGLNFGWMVQNEDIFLFWIKNTGFFIPLLIIAFKRLKPSIEKNILLASCFLFIIPNIFRFAPWPYDNLKVFTYWYFIGSFPVAALIISIYKKSFPFKVIATSIFLSLILSGFIEVFRTFNTQKASIQIYSSKDFEMAKVIREKTEKDSVILTAAIHDHPVTALAGRKIIIGFPGNAWSWGLSDWYQREQIVKSLLKGEQETVNNLSKYNISYVLISDREKYFENQTNEKYFLEKYPVIFKNENFKLFKIK